LKKKKKKKKKETADVAERERLGDSVHHEP
jgi:hypothetical protein